MRVVIIIIIIIIIIITITLIFIIIIIITTSKRCIRSYLCSILVCPLHPLSNRHLFPATITMPWPPAPSARQPPATTILHPAATNRALID